MDTLTTLKSKNGIVFHNDLYHCISLSCRIFQTDRAEGLQVRLLGRQELSGGQAPTESVPVLQISEVPAGGHGEGGGANRLAEGPPRPVAVQAQVAARVAPQPTSVAHHSTRPGPRRHQSGFLVAGLLAGDKLSFGKLNYKMPETYLMSFLNKHLVRTRLSPKNVLCALNYSHHTLLITIIYTYVI